MSDKIDLPDFSEIGGLIESIGKLAELVNLQEIRIKLREAEISRQAAIDPRFFQNGKPPSQTFIDNTWKYTGFENELMPIREELARQAALLEMNKLKYKFLMNLIDVWRTQSANARLQIE